MLKAVLRQTKQVRHISAVPLAVPDALPDALSTDLENIFTVDDFQRQARNCLPKSIYEYLASGSETEQTLREDRSGFSRLALRPRVMRPVSGLSCAVPNYLGTGRSLSLPVFASPAGVHRLVHPEGECATVRACANSGTAFGLSQHATRSIEEVHEAAPLAHRWFQSYLLKDHARTETLVRRAVRAGYAGIYLTVDSVRFGFREADARNGFNSLPDGISLSNYHTEDAGSSCLPTGVWQRQEHAALDQNIEALFDEEASWSDVRWLRDVIDDATAEVAAHSCNSIRPARIPLVVKGVLTGEDAYEAVQAGADGVMVSTHGGRQLDSTLGAIDALPEVVSAVRELEPDAAKCSVLLDSGVRRGTDVVKALALGASAVGVGKPLFFALAVGGQKGVEKMFKILRTETETAMALCGCRTVDELASELVQRR